jgi:hypothetical protein
VTLMTLRKMKTEFREEKPVLYFLQPDEPPLNERLGTTVTLHASGSIFCIACGRKTSKSFNQGYCFPCMRKLAQCDSCMIKPEQCHYHRGTCRDPKWGEASCMIPHLVYLANSSGIKIGITRAFQRLTRWMDQGAVQAIPLATVRNRLDAGLVEVVLKQHFPDKTNWRAMLKGEVESLDMEALRDEALGFLPMHPFAETSVEPAVTLQYPVLEYPRKVQSFNLDKQPQIEGTLLGIKGQYLIFDTGVINVRSHAGYEVTVS